MQCSCIVDSNTLTEQSLSIFYQIYLGPIPIQLLQFKIPNFHYTCTYMYLSLAYGVLVQDHSTNLVTQLPGTFTMSICLYNNYTVTFRPVIVDKFSFLSMSKAFLFVSQYNLFASLFLSVCTLSLEGIEKLTLTNNILYKRKTTVDLQKDA